MSETMPYIDAERRRGECLEDRVGAVERQLTRLEAIAGWTPKEAQSLGISEDRLEESGGLTCSQCGVEGQILFSGRCLKCYTDGQWENPKKVKEKVSGDVPPLPGHARFVMHKGNPQYQKDPMYGVWDSIPELKGGALEECCAIARCWWLDESRGTQTQETINAAGHAEAWAEYAMRGK